MADVELVSTFRVYNVNTQKLETMLHQFFASARFHLTVDGAEAVEWFVVPLPIIREAIARFVDGTIVDYTYNREQQALERSVFDTANRKKTEPFDTTGLEVLSLIIKQDYFDEILRGEKNIEYRDIKSRANEARMTRLDKETGKRYVRRPELLRLYAGYKKDRDILLVRVRDVIYIPPYDIEYHLGPVVEYDVRA
jgi:hypothetical protein